MNSFTVFANSLWPSDKIMPIIEEKNLMIDENTKPKIK